MTDGSHNRVRWELAAGGVASLVSLDQLAKWAVVRWIGPDAEYHRFELAGRYLGFEYVENRGAAFGILSGQTSLLIVLALIVGGIFLATYRHEAARNGWLQLALTLIMAGAIGNLTDRIRLGYVVDYVAVGAWPKFNVADSCITIAILLLAWQALIAPDDESERTTVRHGTATEDRT